MRKTRVRAAVAAAGVAAALLLSACGGSSASAPAAAAPKGNGVELLSATDILAKAQAAASAATSVHVAGKAGTTALDLSFGKGAADAVVGIGGQNIEVVWSGGNYYLKADSATWTSLGNAKAAALLAGKYVKLGPALTGQFKSFTEMAGFFTSALKPTGTVTKGAVTTVDGRRVVTLKDSSDGSLLYIALDGAPYPLKAENATGAQAGAVTFSGWDQPVKVTTPPAAQVVDLSKA